MARMSPPSADAPPLHRFGPADAPVLLRLSEAVAWAPTVEDWRCFAEGGQVFGHVADGLPVSAAALFDYGSLASVGMVQVHPGHQGQGLGRALMQACRAATAAPLLLVATPEGERLYAGLGYRTVGRVHKLFRDGNAAAGRPPEGLRIRTLAAADLPAAAALDRQAFGADRSRVLAARFRQATRGLLLHDAAGRPLGYGLGVPQRHILICGPVVAPDAAAALALLLQLAAGWPATARIDIPERHGGLLSAALAAGFREVDRPPVMLLGADALPGRRELLFGLGAQAIG